MGEIPNECEQCRRALKACWSFEEKTFVKQSLGTMLEILTKLLCLSDAWLRYALGG